MTATAEMLFNLQKFQILTLYTSPEERRGVTDAYAFAWAYGVYPFASESAPWHLPYKDQFPVTEEMLEELSKFLDGLWIQGKTITFYELEEHYSISGSARPGPIWERATLIDACQYFKLKGMFDDKFWKGLVGHSNCPTESHCILSEFGPADVYFL